MTRHVPVSDEDLRVINERWFVPPSLTSVQAQPIISWDSTEDEWLAARRRGVGASEVAVVLGKSSWGSPFALWHAKVGDWDVPRSEEQLIGLELEEAVTGMFVKAHPELHVCKANARLWAHPVYDWLMCTPDRLAFDGETWTVVELKTDEGGKGWGAPYTDEVPLHIRIQVMVQCGILGLSQGFVARLGRKTSGRKFAIYVIDFDPAEFEDYVDEALLFVQSMERNVPPDVDDHKATEDALKRLYPSTVDDDVATVPHPLATGWLLARRQAAEAKAHAKELDNRLRLALGSAGVGMTPRGDVFVKRNQYKRDTFVMPTVSVDELRMVGSRGQRQAGGRLQTTDEIGDSSDSGAGTPAAQEAGQSEGQAAEADRNVEGA